MQKIILLSFFVILCFRIEILAQTTASPQTEVILILNDNSEIRGSVVEEDDNKIVIQNDQLGLLTFQKSELKKINRLTAKGWQVNPNPTKYFIGQSAFSLGKGEGYYQNIMALVNSVQYGITDRLSAGVGVELISLTSGNPIIFANAKYAIPVSDKFRFAASGNFLTLLDEGSIGSLSGLATYGSVENNITLGAGYGIGGGGLTSDAVITLNGMVRIARRFSLVTENYILPGNDEIINLTGLRLINRKNTMDFMLVEGRFPLVSFVFQF
jgi:hypothetical protein